VAEALPLDRQSLCINSRDMLYRNFTLLSTIAPSRSEAEFQAVLKLERVRRVAGRAESQDRIGRLAQIYPSINSSNSQYEEPFSV